MDDEEAHGLVTDAYLVVKSLNEKQKKDLLVLLLAKIIQDDPESAMRYVINVRENS